MTWCGLNHKQNHSTGGVQWKGLQLCGPKLKVIVSNQSYQELNPRTSGLSCKHQFLTLRDDNHGHGNHPSFLPLNVTCLR